MHQSSQTSIERCLTSIERCLNGTPFSVPCRYSCELDLFSGYPPPWRTAEYTERTLWHHHPRRASTMIFSCGIHQGIICQVARAVLPTVLYKHITKTSPSPKKKCANCALYPRNQSKPAAGNDAQTQHSPGGDGQQKSQEPLEPTPDVPITRRHSSSSSTDGRAVGGQQGGRDANNSSSTNTNTNNNRPALHTAASSHHSLKRIDSPAVLRAEADKVFQVSQSASGYLPLLDIVGGITCLRFR